MNGTGRCGWVCRCLLFALRLLREKCLTHTVTHTGKRTNGVNGEKSAKDLILLSGNGPKALEMKGLEALNHLVRMRSPVQIRVAAPKGSDFNRNQNLFCFACSKDNPRLGRGRKNSFQRGVEQTKKKVPVKIEVVCRPHNYRNREVFVVKDKDISSLEHTSWRCQYHVVFAPKYRRMEIYGQIKQDIGVILRKLCQQKGVEIIEAQACPDHIHMLISIPPKYSVSQIMGYLKGKSSLMIFDRHANLKYKYGNRHFWARGYYVDTVGRNKKQVAEYVRNQLASDQIADQVGMKEFVDPFTGRENKKA